MSKYIIDLRPDCKVVQQICESNGQVGVGARSIQYLEELTADYINEHFSDLQDTAYQKGFEDGKKEAESSEAIEQAKADAFNKGILFKEEKIHDAYQRGLEEGKKATFGLVADASNAEYQKGLNDAWECARKIVCDESCGGMSMKELVEIFNKSSDAYILRDFTAQQAIEMLKAYKQKKDDKIEVGDEVKSLSDSGVEIEGLLPWVVTTVDQGDYCQGIDSKGEVHATKKVRACKTGRHFDIASILEAMKHD